MATCACCAIGASNPLTDDRAAASSMSHAARTVRSRRPYAGLVVAIVLGFGFAIAMPAEAKDPLELKLSAAVGPAFPLGRAAERWAQLAEGSAAGAFTVKFHPGASLAQRDPAREFIALRDGAAQLAVGSALAWSAQVPALAVVALPWLAPDRRTLDALVDDARVRAAVAARVEAAGAIMVEWAPLGHRDLATKRAVRVPGDVRGMRLRIAPSTLLTDLYVSLGMLPHSMGFGEAQGAFAAGALDAQEGSATTLASMRVGDVGLTQVVEWGAVADAMVFAVHRATWERWDEAQRAAVRRAASEAVQYAAAPDREEAALRGLADAGLGVARLTAAGRAPFREASRAVYERWSPVVGTEIVELAEQAVKSIEKSNAPRAK